MVKQRLTFSADVQDNGDELRLLAVCGYLYYRK